MEELIYFGDHIRTRLTACATADFIVKVPNSHGHLMITRDQKIRIG